MPPGGFIPPPPTSGPPGPAPPPPPSPPPGQQPPAGYAAWTAAQPGPGRFRPQALGELLDSAFTLYRRNFILIAAIAAVVEIPAGALQYVFLQGATVDAGRAPSNGLVVGVVGVGILQFLLIQPLVQAAMTRAVSDRYLDRPVTVGTSYRSAWLRLRSLIAMSLEQTLLLLALLAPILVLTLVVGPAALVLLAVAVPAAIWGAVRLSFASPIIVIESLSGWNGLKRSWRLIAGSWWRIFGILLLVTIMVAIMGSTINGMLSLPALAIPDPGKLVYTSVIGAVVNVFVTPIRLIVVTLLYYDLRIRREAFDIEMLAASL
ncbi:MAG: glycerophosphoryl diester phosphodiesterase membrane domain-containing protein [Candidatus Dormibacteria bacterium]